MRSHPTILAIWPLVKAGQRELGPKAEESLENRLYAHCYGRISIARLIQSLKETVVVNFISGGSLGQPSLSNSQASGHLHLYISWLKLY
jgi:hypothetical protein